MRGLCDSWQWYNWLMEAATRTREEVYAAIDELVQYRSMCLWFAPKGYLPATDEERIMALKNIERHGDRQAFMRSRELREWFLHVSPAFEE